MIDAAVQIFIILLYLCEVKNELPEKFEHTCKDKNDFIHVKWNKEDRVFLEDPEDIYISQFNSIFLYFVNGIFELRLHGCLIWIDILYYSTFVFKLRKNEKCQVDPIEFEFTQRGRDIKALNLNVTQIQACDADHYYHTDIPENIMSIPNYIGRGRKIFIPIGTANKHTIEAANPNKFKEYGGISFSNGGVNLTCLEKNTGKVLDINIKGHLPIFRLFYQKWQQITFYYKTQITLPVNSDDFLWMDLEQILLIRDSNLKSRIETKPGLYVTIINFKYETTSKNCNYITTRTKTINSIALEVSPSDFCGKKVNVSITYFDTEWRQPFYLNLQFENKCKYSLIEFYKKNVVIKISNKHGSPGLQIINSAPKTIRLLLKYMKDNAEKKIEIIDYASSDTKVCRCMNIGEHDTVACDIMYLVNTLNWRVFASIKNKINEKIWTWGSNAQ